MMDDSYYVQYNFGAIPQHYISYDDAKVVILPVPLESTATYRPGTRSAPEAIISASSHMELYDEELGVTVCKIGIHTAPELALPSDPDKATGIIKETVKKYLDDQKLVSVIGGEHTVTVGAVQATHEHYPDVSVLYLDAHADLRDSYSGTPFNHACVARRVAEICPVVQVGIRSLSEREVPVTNQGNVTTLFARELREGMDVASIVEKLSPNVYVTIDMDVFDPSVVPGVGTPEPGGLDWSQVNALLRAACLSRRVCGFDLVELCPIPGSVVSEYTSARLIYRAIGLIARSRGWFD
jgi:agmatinase